MNLQHALAAAGFRAKSIRPVGGGDINEAWHVELDGETVFVKSNGSAPKGMFEAEARGLAWLQQSDALHIPDVLHIDPHFLVLQWLEPSRRKAGFDEALGRGLAELHRSGAPFFGLDHDNFIGRLHQPNPQRLTWAEFYGEHRLHAMVKKAATHLPSSLRHNLSQLIGRLSALVGPAEPPARLHGDLWAGNLHCAAGDPWLIDPAVYGGHREMDLAMMRLFGGFSQNVFDAYNESYPLAEGHADRVALYQLYPLLVHVNLFGSGYLGSVQAAVRQYL